MCKKMYRLHRHGMTLVELMSVVAIIALLCGIVAYFVSGNRSNNAQSSIVSEIISLINTQRSRAIGLNVAAYIRIDGKSIEPRLGDSSACNTDIIAQLPLRYSASETINVGIDYNNTTHRTLDSIQSNQYYDDTSPLVHLTLSVLNLEGRDINEGLDDAHKVAVNPLVICFQPNGLVYFMNGDSFLDYGYARIDVSTTHDISAVQVITLSSLGSINRYNKV